MVVGGGEAETRSAHYGSLSTVVIQSLFDSPYGNNNCFNVTSLLSFPELVQEEAVPPH